MNFHRLLLAVVAATPSIVHAQALAPGTPITTTQPTTAPTTLPSTAPADALPRSIVLSSGERVTGIIVRRTPDAIIVDSTAMGTVTVRSDAVQQIIGPDGKPEFTAVSNATPTLASDAIDAGLFGSGMLVGWTRQFDFGLTGTAGTIDSTALNAQFNASIDNDRYRSTLGAWYFLNVDSGAQSRNQTRVFGTFDKRINGGPWFVFARGQYDNDSLQNFENRISAFGGPGYEFARNPTYELLGRIGAGYTREFGGIYPDDYTNSRFEALVGLDAKWIIDPTQSLVASCYYYPTITDLDYGRVTTTAAYQIDLTATRKLAFKVGIEHTYEFITAGDDEHNNYKYFTNVVFKF